MPDRTRTLFFIAVCIAVPVVGYFLPPRAFQAVVLFMIGFVVVANNSAIMLILHLMSTDINREEHR